MSFISSNLKKKNQNFGSFRDYSGLHQESFITADGNIYSFCWHSIVYALPLTD